MLSAVLTFVGLLSFYLIGVMDYGKGKRLWGADLADILGGVCLVVHGENFAKGMISLIDVSFFFMFIAFFLIISAKILEARRWRV